MGSSMLLKFMVDRVVTENKLPITLDSDVVSAAKSSRADFLIAGLDLVPVLQSAGKPVVGIRNMVDRSEILTAIEKQLEAFEVQTEQS